MAVFYLDTSAVLKRYRTEKGTDVVDHLYANKRRPDVHGHLRGRRSDVLVTSHFTCLEVESVAARMRKGVRLDSAGYQALLGAFAYDLENIMTIVPVTTALLIESTAVASDFALRPGDSIHLAAAFYAQEQSKDVTVFVTSDKELVEAAQNANMRFLDPESSDALQALAHYLDA